MARRTNVTALDELVEAFGGVEAFAAECGVARETVWRWGKGSEPSALARHAINEKARRRGLRAPFRED